jgi:hypothetical protein
MNFFSATFAPLRQTFMQVTDALIIGLMTKIKVPHQVTGTRSNHCIAEQATLAGPDELILNLQNVLLVPSYLLGKHHNFLGYGTVYNTVSGPFSPAAD